MGQKELETLLKEAGIEKGDFVKISLRNKDYPVFGYVRYISNRPVSTIVFNKEINQYEFGEDGYFVYLALYPPEEFEPITHILSMISENAYGVFFDRNIKSIKKINPNILEEL